MIFDECGVFAVLSTNKNVFPIIVAGLSSLQHRGIDSTGIATYQNNEIQCHKGLGLVSQVFSDLTTCYLSGNAGIGHNRYSTIGTGNIENAGPQIVRDGQNSIAVALNGHLVDEAKLRRIILNSGVHLYSTTDTELIAHCLTNQTVLALLEEDFNSAKQQYKLLQRSDFIEDQILMRLALFMHIGQGAFSIVILANDRIYAARDRYGIRPLCIGTQQDALAISSETCGFKETGFELIRELDPGEIVRVSTPSNIVSYKSQSSKFSYCSLEYAYLSDSASLQNGLSMYTIRKAFGKQLGYEAPTDVDVIVPIPNTAKPHALGYSEATNIPLQEAFVKQNLLGRSFIQPTDEQRIAILQQSLFLSVPFITKTRVTLVDDSLVRGNTLMHVVNMLRSIGVVEIHVRIASPAVRFPCNMGVSIRAFDELIAHKMNSGEMISALNVDSLSFLSYEGYSEVISQSQRVNKGHCAACFTGNYPIKIP